MLNKSSWYSSFSTGIFEVDYQHGNIDALISIFLESTKNELESLLQVYKSAEFHFEYEQNLLGIKFPKEHLAAHTDFLIQFKVLITDFENGSVSKMLVSDSLKMLLIKHVKLFDIFLKELL